MRQKHFTEERWSDYVRGVLPAPETAAIEQHLEHGCQTCQQSVRLWQTVAEVANSEVRNEVPEAVVHTSQAEFFAWRQLHVLPQRARMARLLFDSLREPLPSGVRSEGPSPRRLLGRAGQWSFDLRLEPSGGKRMFLMGQVLRSGQQHGSRVDLPILLMSTGALVAQTIANQFGEFQLQFDQANGLRIYVDFPGNRPIGISLPDLDNPPSAGEPGTD